MGSKGHNTFAIGDILDTLERATREVAKSLDSMRDRVDCDRLTKARAELGRALEQMDSILASERSAS